MKAGSLEIEILANLARLQSDMTRATGIVDRSMGSIKRATDVAKTALGGFVTGLSIGTLVEVGRRGLDYASSLGEVSQQLGVTTRDLQEYRYMATQVGIEQEAMDKGLAKLTQTIGKALKGEKEQAKVFRELGLSLRETNGDVKTAGDLIPEIAEKLGTMPSAAQRAAYEIALFGKAGQQLDTLLAGGADEIDDLRRAAQELGVVLGDDDIQKADQTADKLAAVKTVLEAKIAGIVADNADGILRLADALSSLATAASLMSPTDWEYVFKGAAAGATAGLLLGGPLGAIAGAGIGAGVAAYGRSGMARDRQARKPGPTADGYQFHVMTGQWTVPGKDRPTSGAGVTGPDWEAIEKAEEERNRKAKAALEERNRLLKLQKDFEADTSGLTRQVELIGAGMKVEEARFRIQQAQAGVTEAQIDARIEAEQRLNRVIAERSLTDETAHLADVLDLMRQGATLEEARFRAEQARAGVSWKVVEERLDAERRVNELIAARQVLSTSLDDMAQRDIEGFADAWKRANESVERFLSLKADIDLDGVFGNSGRALGALVNGMDKMVERQEAYAEAVKAAGSDFLALQRIERQRTRLQINDYGNLAGAAKGFFKEGSKGYKALEAAETAFRAIEVGLAIQTAATKIGLLGGVTAAKLSSDAAMAASDTARAGVEQGNSLATTAVKAVEAVVNSIRSLPFPANIAAGAATAAVIASLGVAIGGAFGGGSSKPTYSTGKGTVFGDDEAQSESIARSIQQLTEVDTLTMRYSSQMLASLRNIEANIGGLTNLVQRTGGIEASGGGVELGTKLSGLDGAVFSVLSEIPIVGGLIGGIGKALFGTKTSIIGQGISAGPQSLADIFNGGFAAEYFSDVQKKKKTFGITTSKKYSTQTTAADDELERQFALIFADFNKAIGAAAGPLGISLGEVESKLASFVVDIGRIDLMGLKGEEIQEKLAAIFGAAADNMAQAALPGLEKFQRVGEGYFETIVRVASTVEALNGSFALLGQSTRLGVDAVMMLVDQFGDIGAAQSAIGDYFESFYTDAERAALRTSQLSRVMGDLGLEMPATAAAFRALVEAQDLTTEAGRQAYVALLKLGPTFADVFGTAEDAAQAAADAAAEAAERANAIAEERLGLEERLLQLQGNTAELRRRELEALDPSNRALQLQIWALEEQASATEAAARAASEAQRVLDDTARAAAAIASERAGLERRLLEMQGNTGELRRRELDGLDASNRSLQLYIWSLEDAAAATAEAERAAAAAAAAQAQILSERAGLERQLLELQGNTAALRTRDLASLDASNRALQLQIWALQDQTAAQEQAARAAEEATQAADRLRDAWASITDSLLDEVQRIRGVMGDETGSFATLMARFEDATTLARGGDQDAARLLTSLSGSLLAAAEASAADTAELARIRGRVAGSLEETAALVGGGFASAADVVAMLGNAGAAKPAWWDNFIQGQIAGAQSAANDGAVVAELRRLRSEVSELRAENRAGHAATAGHTGKTARILERVTPDGDAIETRDAA